jgi:predicted dehydrogenase
MAIHDFDLGRWLIGNEVNRVYTEGVLMACPQLKALGDIDNAVVNMLFQGGVLGNVEVSRNAFYGYDIRTEVLGTDGCLQIGYYRQTPLLLLNRQGISHDMVPTMERFGEAYLAQTLDFAERTSMTVLRRSAVLMPVWPWRLPWPPASLITKLGRWSCR